MPPYHNTNLPFYFPPAMAPEVSGAQPAGHIFGRTVTSAPAAASYCSQKAPDGSGAPPLKDLIFKVIDENPKGKATIEEIFIELNRLNPTEFKPDTYSYSGWKNKVRNQLYNHPEFKREGFSSLSTWTLNPAKVLDIQKPSTFEVWSISDLDYELLGTQPSSVSAPFQLDPHSVFQTAFSKPVPETFPHQERSQQLSNRFICQLLMEVPDDLPELSPKENPGLFDLTKPEQKQLAYSKLLKLALENSGYNKMTQAQIEEWLSSNYPARCNPEAPRNASWRQSVVRVLRQGLQENLYTQHTEIENEREVIYWQKRLPEASVTKKTLKREITSVANEPEPSRKKARIESTPPPLK